MKRCCAPIAGVFLFCFTLFTFSAAQAQEPAPAATAESATAVSSILDLLRDKRIISADEAASLLRHSGTGAVSGAELQSLVDLLNQKGVLSGADVAGLRLSRQGTAAPAAEMKLPSQDKNFLKILKERWVKNGNKAADFDELAAEHGDPEDLIGRMRVMGAIGAPEAEELDRMYRDGYLSGAVTTVMENKEEQYLERIRKGVAWELDEKIQGKFKDHWTQNIRLSGDFRLRYQGEFFDENNGQIPNADKPNEVINSTVDRHLVRIRARLGVDAKVADDFAVGIGLATGSSSNPVSTNQTLGDFFNKKTITLDKAFLKWTPAPSFTVWGGRHPNPWFYSDLVWDTDVNFDGVTVQYTPKLSDAWSMFFNAGAFPLQEVELSGHDKWLFGGQLGVQYKRWDRLTARLGVAYYDFENTLGVPNTFNGESTNDFTAPQFQQKGNTKYAISWDSGGNQSKVGYASEYKELNLTGSLDIGVWNPVHVVLLGDYVQNLGFDQQEVEARAGAVDKETVGFQVGLTVGYPKLQEFGDWNVMLSYKYLERDAVIDAFTDSDFHLGGTNAKGWIAGFDYGLDKNLWLSTKWLTANEISGPPLAIDVFQFNVNAKF